MPAESTRPLRVLLTGPSLQDSGGVASFYLALLPELRQRTDLDLQYLEVGSSARRAARHRGVPDLWRFIAAVRQFEPDVIHINPSLNFRSLLRDGAFAGVAGLRGIPVVTFFHGWNSRSARAVDKWWRWPLRLTIGRSEAIFVLASVFREQLLRWGVHAPVQLATTVVDPALVANVEQRSTPVPADDCLRVLFLARLDPAKGALKAIAAVQMLRQRGTRVLLTVAGSGPALPQAQAFLAAHPELQSTIRLVGDVRGAQKQAAFATHDVYCFPSTYGEGMPTSVLEAMACGLPVITSLAGGLADFFEADLMGEVLHQVSAEELATAIARLAADRSRCDRISEYNRHYAQAHFMPAAAATRLHATYCQVMRSP